MSNPESLAQLEQQNSVAINETSQLQEIVHNTKRIIGRCVLALSLATGSAVAINAGEAIVAPARAEATTFANDYPDMDATDCSATYGTYSWCKDGGPLPYRSNRGYDYRNCTDGVARWVGHNLPGYMVPSNWGNAASWETSASTAGYTVYAGNSTNSIEPGDIAQDEAPSPYGHVGFVTDVVKDVNGTVTSITVAELNKDALGSYSHDTYTSRNAAGNFIRNSAGADWDHYIDLNGANKGIGNETIGGGTGVGTRMVGDVNGDGKTDAVVMYRDTGKAFVALSQGNSFGPPQSWMTGHTVGANKYFLGDVNGDNMDDLLAFWASNGQWYANLSSGSGFWQEQSWAMSQGIGTSKQFLAKVNGDTMADMVTFDANTGDWWVSTSSGTGFWPPQRWIAGHGFGSSDQVLADFDGDGKADAGVYFLSNGNWYVAKSNGSSFNGYTQWSAGHGLNSSKRYVGDVNGDGKVDEAFFFLSNGHWDNGMSTGTGFLAPTPWADGQGIGTTEQFLAKLNADSMADMITYDNGTGDWWVSISSGSGFWPPQRWLTGMGKNS